MAEHCEADRRRSQGDLCIPSLDPCDQQQGTRVRTAVESSRWCSRRCAWRDATGRRASRHFAAGRTRYREEIKRDEIEREEIKRDETGAAIETFSIAAFFNDHPLMISPPLGCNTWPVMYDESSHARNTYDGAT